MKKNERNTSSVRTTYSLKRIKKFKSRRIGFYSLHILIPFAFKKNFHKFRQIFKHSSGSANNCRQRVFGNMDGKVRFKPQSFVQPFEQSTATGKHHSTIQNICR